ncbi:Uncharacterised protein [Mycobacteroides abscessus subsp. abscessus]|nr:Uncharacterised protein [Mycobacteroides abscessus subsp. abscessus]
MSTRLQASSEPEPPKVASMKSRTSRPRLTEIWRRALAWFQAEISRMPVAAFSGLRPRRSASSVMRISPPSRCGGMRPRKTWASVMVGSVPPLP